MAIWTGWEIEKISSELLKRSGSDAIQMLLQNYPLVALSDDQDTLIIIRKHHPTLDCSPDNETDKTDSYRYCIGVYASKGCYGVFSLPYAHYTRVQVITEPSGLLSFILVSDLFSVTTNLYELASKVGYRSKPKSDEELLQIYSTLNNVRAPLKIEDPQPATITSSVLGVMKSGEFSDWFISEPIEVGFFEGEKIAFTYLDYVVKEGDDYLRKADAAVRAFLQKKTADRLKTSTLVYKNCMDFLEMVYYDEDDDALHAMTDPQQVWQFTELQEIFVTPENQEIYIRLIFNCDWETEHGLQLVYDGKGELVRVSEDNGRALS